MREDNLDLSKAVKICQAAEATEKQIQTMGQTNNGTLNNEVSVNYCKTRVRHRGGQTQPQSQLQTSHPQPSNGPHTKTKSSNRCSSCDTAHTPRQCPAYGKTCNSCGLSGHYARVCSRRRQKNDNIRCVSRDYDSADSQSELLFVGMVQTKEKRGKQWTQSVQVCNRMIPFKLDTGADVSIIMQHQYQAIRPTPPLEKSEAVMTSYSGTEIPSLGVCRVPVQYKQRRIVVSMEVVRDGPAFLGGSDCVRLGLVRRVHTITTKDTKTQILKSHSQLFRGHGCLPGLHTIVLKEDVLAVIHAPWRVAVAKRPELELERQVQLGFLAKVTEPTDWVNSLVIVEKSNGKMRLCIDPKDLNKVIKREHFQIPTKEEILSRLPGAVFLKTRCDRRIPPDKARPEVVDAHDVQHTFWALSVLTSTDGDLFCARGFS